VEALIFNIQRYSIHDGGGIRTIVFFKGCPLRCPWCANPESQSFEIEIMKLKSLCIHCQPCLNNAEGCPSGALTEQGKWMTVEEVLAEVSKDSVFYNTSGGGVTLSGGEVLSQGAFARELLQRLKTWGIHTAIETTGFGSWETLESLADYTDVILYDLKIIDPAQSKKTMGADSEIILSNLAKLVHKGCRVIPRVPLIPGFTMDEKNISAISALAQKYGLKEIHLLPFHQYGSSKYESLGKDYALKDLAVPSEKEVNAIKSQLEAQGFMVVVGGE